MDDLISRQAALALAKDISVPTKDGSIYRHRCIDPDAIRELPSAQARIIRCKDCHYCVVEKSWSRTYYYCDAFSYHAEGDLIGVSLQVSPEHFCGWAERRTDG